MKRIFSGLALCVPLATLAQAPEPAAADPEAGAPALHYASAFTDYKAWQDIEPGDWRLLNDNVAPRDGSGAGHAGHGAATTRAPAASTAEAATPAARPDGVHRGHDLHGGRK